MRIGNSCHSQVRIEYYLLTWSLFMYFFFAGGGGVQRVGVTDATAASRFPPRLSCR